jgi:predicted HTH transcriptional regulator
MNLETLVRRPEGKTLEFKRDLSSPDGALRTIVAFANTAGGMLLIGVEDGTRAVVGIEDPLALDERLANLISDRIAPTLVPDIELLHWRGKNVLLVQVYPSPTRPHHLRRLGPEAGVLVRVGSTNRRADATLVEEIRRYTRNEAFDELPLADLDSEAVDFLAASESFADLRRLSRKDLETLRVLTLHQRRVVPTVGGVLLFGRDRFKLFPDAWIQAGRFLGTDRSRILDTAEIRSHLAHTVDEALAFIQRNVAREAVIEGARRVERWAYPLIAVREAVVNAVVHADYSQRGAPIRVSIFADRLEVENPGLLPFGLTVDEIRSGISKLRNRVIGRVFNELGLIEAWGSGIQRMTRACEDAGLQVPILEEVGTHFRVTLLAGAQGPPRFDEVDRSILSVLRETEGLSTRQVAEKIERSVRGTRTRLASLVDRGLVVELSTGPHDPKRRYLAADEGLPS